MWLKLVHADPAAVPMTCPADTYEKIYKVFYDIIYDLRYFDNTAFAVRGKVEYP